MPTARLAEVEIYHEEHGSGEPVLLVPPSWWPCDTWNVVVVPLLSRYYRTIIFEPRGTGRSSHPDHGYTISQFARDSIELLQQLGVSRCHAVGFALGGEIAQAMAIERPDIVATLTMAATGPGSKSLQGGRREASSEGEREIQHLGFERFIRSHVENDTMAFGPTFYKEHPDVVAALSQHLLDEGFSFTSLFTDLANPTSNQIYMNIGYQPLAGQFLYKTAATGKLLATLAGGKPAVVFNDHAFKGFDYFLQSLLFVIGWALAMVVASCSRLKTYRLRSFASVTCGERVIMASISSNTASLS